MVALFVDFKIYREIWKESMKSRMGQNGAILCGIVCYKIAAYCLHGRDFGEFGENECEINIFEIMLSRSIARLAAFPAFRYHPSIKFGRGGASAGEVAAPAVRLDAKTLTVREAINMALDEEISRDPNVFLIGNLFGK
jgi:hypothetical protein